MFTKKNMLTYLLTLSFFSTSLAIANVKLPSIISDNMVLQQNTQAPIWGWADPGEKIEVNASWQLLCQTKTTADQSGNWEVKLKTPSAGGPYSVTIKANNKIIIKNILVGEVWLASGQSNMHRPLSDCCDANNEIAKAEYPNIRFFSVETKEADSPQEDCEGQWQRCMPETAAGFSAVGYFFGRDLQKELDVPIGLIHSSYGGTPAESWTRKEILESSEEFRPILNRWQTTIDRYPQARKDFEEKRKKWQQNALSAKSKGLKLPPKPIAPVGPGYRRTPCGLYNAMINPLIPYAIRGVIWYQGEGNTKRAYQYRKLFPAMIFDWRKQWGQGYFPFLFVQLANFRAVKPEPQESDWAELREAQLMSLQVPNTAMAVAIDIGDANTIHPKNKQDVGKRLALCALGKVYDKDVIYSGPTYKSMRIKGNKIILTFEKCGEGLIAKGSDELKGFAIAGEDRKFVWAKAMIEGQFVIVSSEKINNPVAVRYGWATNPVCNLYNLEGLPASPFRTDNWPGLTFGKN